VLGIALGLSSLYRSLQTLGFEQFLVVIRDLHVLSSFEKTQPKRDFESVCAAVGRQSDTGA
jgi:hypothetical protein